MASTLAWLDRYLFVEDHSHKVNDRLRIASRLLPVKFLVSLCGSCEASPLVIELGKIHVA